MSTRRTTRAGSRAASSVGGAHAVGPDDIPVARTPGRGRPRKTAGSVAGSERSTGLPSMAPSTSTAYGTNTLALPNYGPRGAPLANDISSVIESLLEPEPINKGSRPRPGSQEPVPDVDAPAVQPIPGAPAYIPSMRSRSGPVKRRVPPHTVDRNFQNESQLFHDASIMSSSYQQDDFLSFSGPSLDEGEVNRRVALRDLIEEQQYMRGGAQDRTSFNLGNVLRSPGHFFKKIAKSFSDNFGDATKSLLPLLALGSIAFIAWFAYLNSGGPSLHWYGSDISANLGQFIPSQVKHPSRIFAPGDLKDVYRRLDIAESDIAFLKHRSTIDKNALAEIKKILPDFIALDKDYNGKPALPANLWQAMREKIRADPSLIPSPSQSPREVPPPTSSKSDPRSHEVFNSKEFDRYLESNRVKIQSWAGSEFDVLHPTRIQQLIKDGKIASKDDVVELIKKNWRDSSQEVRSELQKLTKDLEHKVSNLGKQALTAEQVKELANEVVKAQIEAIARTNVNRQVGQAIHRMDHLAKRSGSAIIPRLTSPSYRFPHQDLNFIRRGIAWAAHHPIPLPPSAETALTSWDEIGDCWCSPQQNGDGPTLGVLTAYNIWPDQVVVEHYPHSGYTNSGFSPLSAPKQMELLAYMSYTPKFLRVKAYSDRLFPKDKPENLESGWVQLAAWSYDASGPSIQTFPVQIDLKDFVTEEDLKKDQSATNKFLIRIKSNQGQGTVPYTCLYRVRLHGEVKPDENY
ncbi:hypothetical protein SBOR_4409 [Sclerotinia borealis F-4128]|uniref:SUN domain-containing protein n=1 Tax=Sclerotinia borealis (strain F-4128) TaxID=1432307 RepID=W9CL14_SCLBF|nr:hypothetical protein SBOR_4409 [Sclerotinia borealis F-4128]